MRFHAPAREAVDATVFQRPPLRDWYQAYPDWLGARDWPEVTALNAVLAGVPGLQLVCQDADLLADGLHYETRIGRCGAIATRPHNWHDLFNALIWGRYPQIKRALNRQQLLEIDQVGPRVRSRVQCALTHFDEAGVMLRLRDPALLALWDRHDWEGLFWRHRQAWLDGSICCEVFGHALLEHALVPGALLVGKALVVLDPSGSIAADDTAALGTMLAAEIDAGRLLRDPQELRPLPLSGIPGWHPAQLEPGFYHRAPCFRPLRADRVYPPPVQCVPADRAADAGGDGSQSHAA